MNRVRVVFMGTCALLLAGGVASAHHSFAAVFDANQPVTVKGIVTEVRLENPHSWFFIDVKDASGKVEKWAFEGSTPTSTPAQRRQAGIRQTGRRSHDQGLSRARRVAECRSGAGAGAGRRPRVCDRPDVRTRRPLTGLALEECLMKRARMFTSSRHAAASP